MDSSLVPPEAYAAALAAVPGLGPAGLRSLLEERTPEQAWSAVLRGQAPVSRSGKGRPDPGPAAALDPLALLARCRHLGVEVLVRGSARYPAVLAHDPEPPAVLFASGDLALLDGVRVAVVGTRTATPAGTEIARRLGGLLAEAGAAVVSGLALGIDGSAHRGALEAGGAGPIGVVGSGHDVVYPPRHRDLWRDVARRGLLLSEAPPGTGPQKWRFPARNRIIAALADVVVVVESHAKGGSLVTAAEALRRDRAVLAVPGSIASPASAGTNRLIYDGAVPVCDLDDVLVAVGLARSGAMPDGPPTFDAGDPLLAVLAGGPLMIDGLVAQTGASLGEVSRRLAELEDLGAVTERRGWWHRVR